MNEKETTAEKTVALFEQLVSRQDEQWAQAAAQEKERQRDWFAGQAMQKIFSVGSLRDYELMAQEAYRMADAMLKVRG